MFSTWLCIGDNKPHCTGQLSFPPKRCTGPHDCVLDYLKKGLILPNLFHHVPIFHFDLSCYFTGHGVLESCFPCKQPRLLSHHQWYGQFSCHHHYLQCPLYLRFWMAVRRAAHSVSKTEMCLSVSCFASSSRMCHLVWMTEWGYCFLFSHQSGRTHEERVERFNIRLNH